MVMCAMVGWGIQNVQKQLHAMNDFALKSNTTFSADKRALTVVVGNIGTNSILEEHKIVKQTSSFEGSSTPHDAQHGRFWWHVVD